MTTRKTSFAAVTCLVTLGLLSVPSRAGLVSDINRGFQLAGGSYLGDDNVLTGGREFLATNNFSGNSIDFGPWSLTLQGPLSTGFSIANRPFQSFSFSFGTTPTSRTTPSPLTYSLDFNLGDQSGRFSGSLLLDGGGSVDRLGFYTVRLDASSRNTLTRGDGSSDEFDSNLGPVNIAGNVYVDTIAFLTAPLFEAANIVSPFDSLTARAQIQSIVDTQTNQLLELLRNGETPGNRTTQRGISLTTESTGPFGTGVLDTPIASATGTGIVPEPTVVVLMLAGLPLLLRRKAKA